MYGVHSSQDLKLLSPESQNLVDVTLSEGLRYCRDNNIFCDAQINCSTGKPINAHKIILSARYSFFFKKIKSLLNFFSLVLIILVIYIQKDGTVIITI